MLKGAFFVETSAKLLIKVALGHFGHVVFVKKFAVIALLAKTAQPMLTNHSSITPDVPVGAHGLPLAVTPEIEIADSGGGFVHVRKGIGQDANVVVEGDLHVEDMIVIDGAHYVHHFRESSLPMRRGKKICLIV